MAEPFASAEAGFRNKAKLVVTGSAAVTAAGLEPYDVAARTGELTNVIVTLSPDREAMVRFVRRSADRLDALRAAVPGLLDDLAARGTPAAVVSANLLLSLIHI